MRVFFWDKNIYRIAKVKSEIGNNIELIFSSGEEKKINKTKVPFVFVIDNEKNFIDRTEKFFVNLDVNEVWKASPKENFTICDLNNILFFQQKNCTNKAALLMCILKNPIYFRKKQDGFFCSVSQEVINSAIKSEKLKAKNLKDEAFLINQILEGEIPEKIKKIENKLFFETSKQSIEYKAVKKAGMIMGLKPVEILYKIGFLKSAFEYHKLVFLNKNKETAEDNNNPLIESKKNPLFSNFIFPNAKAEAYSIDDASTSEIDDAFSLSKTETNPVQWIVGIHIALPVKFLTIQECESMGVRDQALSIYSPSEKKTMLPKGVLEKASLDENTIKPVLSLYVNFDENAEIIKHNTVLENIFIKKNIRLGDWENEFEKNPFTEKLPWAGLKDLYALSKKLSKKRSVKKTNKPRIKPEFKISVLERNTNSLENLDLQGVPVVEVRRRGSIADTVVSEFMVLANSIWALRLSNSSMPAIFRVNVSGLTRMQTSVGPHNDLGVDAYAWTTSPLRRHIDFINQWQLVCSILPINNSLILQKEKVILEIKNYEKKQFLYSNFQKFMEKYWTLRWMILKTNKFGEFWEKTDGNRFLLNGIYLGKGQYCLIDAPFTFRLTNSEDLIKGEKVKLEIESINCLDMKVKFSRA